MHGKQPHCTAVAHVCSLHAAAVAVPTDVDADDAMPLLTSDCVRRVDPVPPMSRFAPGDARLAEAVRGDAVGHPALLPADHGPAVTGTALSAAAEAIEALEATVQRDLPPRNESCRPLAGAQVTGRRQRYPA